MEGELALACSIVAELRNCKTAKLRNREIAEIKRMEGELALASSIVAELRKCKTAELRKC